MESLFWARQPQIEWALQEMEIAAEMTASRLLAGG